MYSFKKEERLCNVKLIEKLFTEGSSFLVYPFRIVWLSEVNTSSYPVQVLISVPKKRFKRAVDRNLIKRRIREVYRLNKLEHLFPLLLNQSGGLILGITYIGKEVGDYAFLVKLKKLFQNSHVEKDI